MGMREGNGRFNEFLTENKTAVYFGGAVLFFVISIIAMLLKEAASAGVFAVGAAGLLFMALPGSFEHFKFGTMELKVRRAEQAVDEARTLAKLIIEMAVPLVHRSDGWADTAPSTIKTKELVLPKALAEAKRLGLEIDPAVLELDYYSTCADYLRFLIDSRKTNNERMQIIDQLKCRDIATSIDDVEPPESLKKIFEDLNFMCDEASQVLDDYDFYYRNREHRDLARWARRAEWFKEEVVGALADEGSTPV
jgi:hypothetical protein